MNTRRLRSRWKIVGGLLATLLLAIASQSVMADSDLPAAYPGYRGVYPGFTLVLDERFDTLDPALWALGDGAVGTEAMCRFQSQGVRISEGVLELVIDRAPIAAGWSNDHRKLKRAYDYYCGEVRTRPDRRIRYGRIEARIKAPDRRTASGYITSLFTYVKEPREGLGIEWEEIDIELEGGRPDAFQANLIYGINAETWTETRHFGAWEHKIDIGAVDRWRVFAIEWLPDRISWYVDGALVKTLRATDTDCDPTCVPPQRAPAPIPDSLTDVMINFWIPNDDIDEVFGGSKSANVYPLRSRYDWLRLYQYDEEPLVNWADRIDTAQPAEVAP